MKEFDVAVKLRLARTGKKKQPQYRIVAADSRVARDGRFLEILGWYAPRRDPSEFKVDREAASKWLAQGAQPTETVRKIFKLADVEGLK
ncbi:MAG: 30S ribosomal protein S16 [Ferrimicrobium sp.]